MVRATLPRAERLTAVDVPSVSTQSCRITSAVKLTGLYKLAFGAGENSYRGSGVKVLAGPAAYL